VRVGHKRRVVATHERAVQRAPHAGVGLGTGHDEVTDLPLGQKVLELGLLEGVAVVLVDEGLAVVALQLVDVLPTVGALG
jgi:hypothetical protein